MVCVMDNFLAVERKVGYSTRMIVDRILEYYGINPAVYPVVEDKWIVVVSEILLSAYIYIPITFGLLGLLYLYTRRKKYRKNPKKFVAMIVLYPLVGGIVGCVVIYIIIAIIAALAVNSLYGGTL